MIMVQIMVHFDVGPNGPDNGPFLYKWSFFEWSKLWSILILQVISRMVRQMVHLDSGDYRRMVQIMVHFGPGSCSSNGPNNGPFLFLQLFFEWSKYWSIFLNGPHNGPFPDYMKEVS